MNKKVMISLAMSGVLASTMLAGCGSSSSTSGTTADGKVKITFFQNKTEAKASYDKLIQKFEQENPNIVVTQVNPPDAETVLKTDVAKHNIPDVMGLGDNASYAELAKDGVFADFSSAAELKQVTPAYVDMLNKVTGLSKTNGIPYTANANGILYNKTLFKQLGLTVPTTWDELIADAQKVKAAGQLPFYFTLKDSWTSLVTFNGLTSNLQGDNFMTDRAAGKVTFASAPGYKEIAQKDLQLLSFGNTDMNGKGYDDGNKAFAQGKSVMYIQGVWAIPDIKKANPNIELGSFPMPVSNDASQNRLVSGVDTLLTMSNTTQHKAEAMKFIDFLLKDENAKQFITEQSEFSCEPTVTQDDPTEADLKPAFQQGKVVDFADHYFPSAMQIDKLVQSFDEKKDSNAFLSNLDTQWNKVQNR